MITFSGRKSYCLELFYWFNWYPWLKKNAKIGLEKSFSQFVENFRNSESMKKIKEFLQQATKDSSISFKAIIVEEIQTAIKDLPINKSTYLVIFQQKFIRNMLRWTPKTGRYF